MKKARTIALAILMAMVAAIGASAQDQETVRLYDGSRSDKFLELDLHAGVGLSTVIQNYSSEIPGLSDFLLSPGCLVRMGVDVRFVIRKSFGLGTGLEFGINNSHYAMSIVDNATESISSLYVGNHYYDLNVPVYLSWRLNLGRKMMWIIDGGVFFAQGFRGHTRVSGYASGQNTLGQPIISSASYETKYFKAATPLVNGVKHFDWGPRVATGFLYKDRYSLKAVFQLSASNLAINQGVLDIKYRHLSLCFLFGYTF